MATTIEVTKGKAWGFGAILILIVILLGLAFAATNMLQGNDAKKMSEKVDDLLKKVTATNETIEGVDGAVKKFPQQLKEAIADHEQRLHRRKPVHRTAAKKHAPLIKNEQAQVTKITAAKADEIGVPAQAIKECTEKFNGEIVLDGKNIVCRPIKPQVVEQRKEESAPVKTTTTPPAPKEDFYDRVVAPAPAPVYRAAEDVSQQQPAKVAESSGSSWVPWVLGAGGALLLISSLRKGSSPALVQGPVNPAPGGPVNPVP